MEVINNNKVINNSVFSISSRLETIIVLWIKQKRISHFVNLLFFYVFQKLLSEIESGNYFDSYLVISIFEIVWRF